MPAFARILSRSRWLRMTFSELPEVPLQNALFQGIPGGLRAFVRHGWPAGLLALLICCAPSRDTVLKDVERNFTAVGFLDTDTFQVRCLLAEAEGAARLEPCHDKLIGELVAYKERYDREAFARRMHQDFLPFSKPIEASTESRDKWRAFYVSLAVNRTRLVFEKAVASGVEGAYRLRTKDLIYRVQRVE